MSNLNKAASMSEDVSVASIDLLLDAHAIHAWYGSSHVLHGIDLQIGRGETIGLLGRNGMGKSTLIRSLLGHVAQREGHLTLFGQDCSRAQPHEVARLGVAYVPEGRGVFPNLTVRENLMMATRRGRDGRNDWSLERCWKLFRGCRRDSAILVRSCLAASSKCCRSAVR